MNLPFGRVPQNGIVIFYSDPVARKRVATRFRSSGHEVFTPDSATELRALVAGRRARVAVVDLRLVELSDVMVLQTNATVVCVHHCPDERMWAGALAAGAIDCCYDDDQEAILKAVYRGPLAAATAA